MFQKESQQNKPGENTNQVKCDHDQKIITKNVLTPSHTGNTYPAITKDSLYEYELPPKYTLKLASENQFRKHHPTREVSYGSYGSQDEETLAPRSTISSNLSTSPRSRSYTIDSLTGTTLMPRSNATDLKVEYEKPCKEFLQARKNSI
uniref:Uncharacterized protein n=1 Tax=Acrobeloides nanus TaxID=290746 RepID=A0A914D4H7_9BILA